NSFFNPNGKMTVSADDTASAVAIDRTGKIYAAGQSNTLYLTNPDGDYVDNGIGASIAGFGPSGTESSFGQNLFLDNGLGTDAAYDEYTSIATDSDGNVAIADPDSKS